MTDSESEDRLVELYKLMCSLSVEHDANDAALRRGEKGAEIVLIYDEPELGLHRSEGREEVEYEDRVPTDRSLRGVQKYDFDQIDHKTDVVVEGRHNVRVCIDPEEGVVEVGPEEGETGEVFYA